MAGVVAAERVLSNFARRSHIPADAEQWLINAIDPCHDRLTKLTGYPDDNQSASCVQRVKQAYTIKAPGSTASSALWDLMVLSTPLMNSQQVVGYSSGSLSTPSNTINDNLLTLTSVNAGLGSYGGLMFIAVPSTTGFTWSNVQSAISAGTGYNIANTLPSTYSQGSSRIIGSAFEVCNTTAELTVQGSVATFRQPIQDFEDAGTFTLLSSLSGATAGIITIASCLPIPGPPANLAQAFLLPGTRQWKAKEGAYVVSVLNSERLPPQDFNLTVPVIYQKGSDGSTASLIGPTTFNSGYNLTGSSTVGFTGTNFWNNFDQSGCIFTGLSATTTLQLSWINDVERFPTEQQGDLVVLATPSTVYSPTCIEAYSMITQDLPTGVPFGQNGLGDWFMGAVKNVSSIITPVLKTVAEKNPAVKTLLGFQDIVTKGNSGGGKKGKKDKAGKGFLAPPSIANNDRAMEAKRQMKSKNGKAPAGMKWVAKK